MFNECAELVPHNRAQVKFSSILGTSYYIWLFTITINYPIYFIGFSPLLIAVVNIHFNL